MPRANPDVNYEISIHALLAESDRSLLLPVRGSRISIHALLAESDIDAAVEVAHIRNFYPRSPCGERHTEIDLNGVADLFLSTLSLRRATAGAKATANATWNFYPRSPCGERRAYSLPSSTISTISIHALLAESDDADRAALCERCIFLSTLSLRRATCRIAGNSLSWVFLSTLSLRRATVISFTVYTSFLFLSTLSLRRATRTQSASLSL